MTTPDLFTVDDLADRWGVNHKTVRAMIDRGALRCFRVGRLISAIRRGRAWKDVA